MRDRLAVFACTLGFAACVGLSQSETRTTSGATENVIHGSGQAAIQGTDDAAAPPYMGQEPPGLVPKVFAPGLVSVPGRFEHSICLSKDGRECYFTVRAADWSSSRIMATRLENGKWTQAVPFSIGNMCPSLADNDQSLYFIGGAKVWRVRRFQSGSGTQWQYQPELLPAPANSPQPGWSCHLSSLGNLWICSWRPGGLGRCDLWRIRSVGGKFTEAENLRNLNTTGFDCYPVPGPNEDYVVYSSDRPGGFGRNDLYVSFADGHGGWTAPRNLGPTINSSNHDSSPYLSPDYKYLFFARETSTDADIYWVRVEAFLPDPNGPKSKSRQTIGMMEGSK
jgi:hypothetical protein